MLTRHPVTNFFAPHKFDLNKGNLNRHVAAVVPSFRPSELTVKLVGDLLNSDEKMVVCVVDDSTPEEYEAEHGFFGKIRSLSDRVVVLRTPENKLKAGAINHGLNYIFNPANIGELDVVLTLDDDVVITKNTIRKLVDNLFEDDKVGAVCSQCRVLNKNENILTRLQGLEYLGYNALRLADEGFFNGPLVMHGMLTAFRADALKEAGLFIENHLIEDYEITARLKTNGWHVRLAPHAYAWTQVPSRFRDLWRQRTRWTYGGITIISAVRHAPAVIQDIIGHSLFIFTLMLIAASFAFFGSPGSIPHIVTTLIIVFSLVQVAVWYIFQMWFLRFYKERDWKDVLVRTSLLPEFIYANVLSLILIGAYVFHVSNITFDRLGKRSKIIRSLRIKVDRMFARFGYTKRWGTRQA